MDGYIRLRPGYFARIRLVFVLSATMLLLIWSQVASADLQVYPTRMVIDARTRTGSFNLRHLGIKTTRYKISPTFYQMNTDGTLNKIAEPAASDPYAGNMIVYSPRIVTLEPEREQIVRIQVRRPPNLPDGEYRMHLQFETFEEVDAQEIAKGTDSARGVRMALKAHKAIAVPVIVYQGQVHADLQLTVADKKIITSSIPLTLTRTGNRSVFGNLRAEFQSAGTWHQLTEIKGIAVYGQERNLELSFDQSKIPKGSPLRVSFNEDNARGINASIILPN
jgi:hypothetical protein